MNPEIKTKQLTDQEILIQIQEKARKTHIEKMQNPDIKWLTSRY